MVQWRGGALGAALEAVRWTGLGLGSARAKQETGNVMMGFRAWPVYRVRFSLLLNESPPWYIVLKKI
jgi:hypothetical protein